MIEPTRGRHARWRRAARALWPRLLCSAVSLVAGCALLVRISGLPWWLGLLLMLLPAAPLLPAALRAPSAPGQPRSSGLEQATTILIGTSGSASRSRHLIGGRYLLRGAIYRGALSSVYRAHDLAVPAGEDPVVALKLLPARREPESVEQCYWNEIHAHRHLGRHLWIAALLNHGACEAGRYAVFEYVPRSIEEVALSQDWRWLLQRMTEAVDALHWMAARGILHGDIKPANLGIARDGRLRVLDLGLACWTGPGRSPLAGPEIHGGTPGYIAPERCRGGVPPTQRSDIYALGMTFRALRLLLPEPARGPGAVGMLLDRLCAEAPLRRPALWHALSAELGMLGVHGCR